MSRTIARVNETRSLAWQLGTQKSFVGTLCNTGRYLLLHEVLTKYRESHAYKSVLIESELALGQNKF